MNCRGPQLREIASIRVNDALALISHNEVPTHQHGRFAQLGSSNRGDIILESSFCLNIQWMVDNTNLQGERIEYRQIEISLYRAFL